MERVKLGRFTGIFFHCLILFLFLSSASAGFIRKIIQGTNAKQCEFPWMVSLAIKNGPQESFCGGTILDATHILTAAHCFENGMQELLLQLGGNDLNSMPYKILVGPSSVHIHKGFQGAPNFQNDIAIVSLRHPLKFNTCVQPLPLEQRGDKFQGPCVIAGWGKTEAHLQSPELKNANVRWYPNSMCQQLIPQLTEQQLCAGSLVPNQAQSCNGDSGGPLMCRRQSDNELVMVGITSFGDIKCNIGLAVYTRVSYFMDWIYYVNELDSVNTSVPNRQPSPCQGEEKRPQIRIEAHLPTDPDDPIFHLIKIVLHTVSV